MLRMLQLRCVPACSGLPDGDMEASCWRPCICASPHTLGLHSNLLHPCVPLCCRRLFANRGSEQMDLNLRFVGKKPPKRRLTNATFDEDLP